MGIVDKTKALSPQLVANYFLQAVDSDSGDNITHLKLQKLIYYAQAWWLANFNRALFDEDMEAWAHGPVTPSIWRKYRESRWDPLFLSDGAEMPPSDIQEFLAVVWDKYGEFSAKKLEQMTHNDAPWRDVRGGLPPEAKCTEVIPMEAIRDFYAKKIDKDWHARS